MESLWSDEQDDMLFNLIGVSSSHICKRKKWRCDSPTRSGRGGFEDAKYHGVTLNVYCVHNHRRWASSDSPIENANTDLCRSTSSPEAQRWEYERTPYLHYKLGNISLVKSRSKFNWHRLYWIRKQWNNQIDIKVNLNARYLKIGTFLSIRLLLYLVEK